MIDYINWGIIIGLCCGAVGFWTYTYELIQGRVSMSTRWRDLKGYALEVYILSMGGLALFIVSLIARVLLSSRAA